MDDQDNQYQSTTVASGPASSATYLFRYALILILPHAAIKVLVIGGCGFIGYHIVKALLAEKEPSFLVHVMSRNPNRNQVPGQEYHVGDSTPEESVTKILTAVQPVAISHLASPVPAGTPAATSYSTT